MHGKAQTGENKDVRHIHKGDIYCSFLISPNEGGFFPLRTSLIFSTCLFGCLIGKFKEKPGCPGLSLTLCSSISFPPAVAIPTGSYLILSFHVRKFLCLLPKPTVSHIIHMKGGILPSYVLHFSEIRKSISSFNGDHNNGPGVVREMWHWRQQREELDTRL